MEEEKSTRSRFSNISTHRHLVFKNQLHGLLGCDSFFEGGGIIRLWLFFLKGWGGGAKSNWGRKKSDVKSSKSRRKVPSCQVAAPVESSGCCGASVRVGADYCVRYRRAPRQPLQSPSHSDVKNESHAEERLSLSLSLSLSQIQFHLNACFVGNKCCINNITKASIAFHV